MDEHSFTGGRQLNYHRRGIYFGFRINPSESSPAPQVFPSPSPSAPEVPSSQSQEVEGFLFESQGCTRTKETRIKCAVLITNKEKDRELTLYRSGSRMIDSKGVEYGAYGAVFGGSESSTSNLIQDVGARAEIVFEEVPTEVNQLTLIELSVYVEEIEETFVVQFRNISILS